MKKIVFSSVLITLLVSCTPTPSPKAIEEAIQQTQMAQPTEQSAPTQMADTGNWVLDWQDSSYVEIWEYPTTKFKGAEPILSFICQDNDLFVMVLNTDYGVKVSSTNKTSKYATISYTTYDSNDNTIDVQVRTNTIILNDYNLVGFFDSYDFLKKILPAERLYLKYETDYDEYIGEFRLDGLENAIKPVLEACNLNN